MNYEEKFKEIEKRKNLNKQERLEKERMQELAGINNSNSSKIKENMFKFKQIVNEIINELK